MSHRPGPCAECGQPWPCATSILDRHRREVEVWACEGHVKVVHRNRLGEDLGGPHFAAGEYEQYRVPINDAQLLRTLRAIGWTVDVDDAGDPVTLKDQRGRSLL